MNDSVIKFGMLTYSLAATLGVGNVVGVLVGNCVGAFVGPPKQRPVRSEQVPVPSQKVETVDKSAMVSSMISTRCEKVQTPTLPPA